MSHTIVYGRQFVKTSRGIIPLVLCGSSNCTEFHDGRERLERSWSVFYNNTMIELPEDELMAKVYDLHQTPRNEEFTMNGKYLNTAQVIKFFQNGIKAALSIEEILERSSGATLSGQLSVWGKKVDDRHYTELFCPGMRTTAEIETWLDKAGKRLEELIKDNGVFICLRFSDNEPLRLGKSCETDGPVIVKMKKYYLSEYSLYEAGNEIDGITRSPDITKAIVFDNIDDAISKLPKINRFGVIQFIKAENKDVIKNIVLLVSDGNKKGYYISKLGHKTMSFSHTPANAKKFLSEKEAKKWFEAKVKGRFSGVITAIPEAIKVA